MSYPQSASVDIGTVELPLERDWFVRSLIRELSGLLEDVVGLEEASGFISVVGQKIGAAVDKQYRHALSVDRLDSVQIGEVLVDLKRRIQGDFYIIEQDPDKIVLGNRRCPFAEMVKDRPSLCMMTSNVFGTIAAESNGYAKVSLEETIAQGDGGCRVVVYLNPTDEAKSSDGHEYFKAD